MQRIKNILLFLQYLIGTIRARSLSSFVVRDLRNLVRDSHTRFKTIPKKVSSELIRRVLGLVSGRFGDKTLQNSHKPGSHRHLYLICNYVSINHF